MPARASPRRRRRLTTRSTDDSLSRQMSIVAVSTPMAAALSIAGILAVTVIAVWLLSRWRESSSDEFDATTASLKEFEEMRLGGDLTEEEFRNIKGLLANEGGTGEAAGFDKR